MLPIALLSLVLSVPVPAASLDLEGFVARLFAPALEREGVPGLSVAILLDGQLVFARGYGWADERLGIPMQPQTVFPIGSLGRSLCAAAALREVERGALALDAPLGKLLPDVPAPLQPITLRQLLDGTSGLPGNAALQARFAERPPAQRLTQKEFLELLAALPPQAAPGASFAADSSAWLLIPLIVSEAGKRSFADCVAQELCAPLGLYGTLVRYASSGMLGHAADCLDAPSGPLHERRSGFEPREAGAGFFSTPSDLVRWQHALFQETLLSAPSTRIVCESPGSRTDGIPELNACFELGELGGNASWRHVGGIAGWRGALSWYEGARLSVCVLGNCGSARVGVYEEEIARFLLHLAPRELQDLPLENGDVALLCGGYQLGTTRVRIHERDGQLWYESAAEEPFRLRSQGFRRFVSANGERLLEFSAENPRALSFEERRGVSTSIARRMD